MSITDENYVTGMFFLDDVTECGVCTYDIEHTEDFFVNLLHIENTNAPDDVDAPETITTCTHCGAIVEAESERVVGKVADDDISSQLREDVKWVECYTA